MTKFDPNEVTFAEGAVRVERIARKHGIGLSKIYTSKDKEITSAIRDLPVTNVSKEFKKWQLPFIFNPTQLFFTEASANAKVPEHSHDEGNGIRFIIDGSISYKGQTLSAGDWMFIPKGIPYSMEIGPKGARMCYCYECCCAGRADLGEFVSNPPD